MGAAPEELRANRLNGQRAGANRARTMRNFAREILHTATARRRENQRAGSDLVYGESSPSTTGD